MTKLFKNILLNFVKENCITNCSLNQINFGEYKNHLKSDEIYLGVYVKELKKR